MRSGIIKERDTLLEILHFISNLAEEAGHYAVLALKEAKNHERHHCKTCEYTIKAEVYEYVARRMTDIIEKHLK